MNRHLISCFYMTTNTVSKFHQNRSRSVKWFLYNSLHIYRELLLSFSQVPQVLSALQVRSVKLMMRPIILFSSLCGWGASVFGEFLDLFELKNYFELIIWFNKYHFYFFCHSNPSK